MSPDEQTSVVDEWAQNTSCNGIPNIQRAQAGFRKLFWLLLVLSGIGMTMFQTVDLIIEYYQYPVNVNINITATNILDFPSVTFCNLNAVRRNGILRSSNPLIKEQAAVIVGRLNSTSADQLSPNSKERFSTVDKFMRIISTIPEREREELGHQLHLMLVDCTFNGDECNSSDFRHFVSSAYGNCYTFNPGVDPYVIYKSFQTGPTFGLSVELFVEQDEYIPDLTEAAGIRVVVHDQKSMPYPEQKGFYAYPGTFTSVGIQKTTINRLPAPYTSKCWDKTNSASKTHDANSEKHKVDYSFTGCLYSCYQSYVHFECGCADPRVTFNVSAVLTLVNDSVEYHPCRTEEQVVCESGVLWKQNHDMLDCNCGLPCYEVGYQTTISSAQWPNHYYAKTYFMNVAAVSPRYADAINSKNSHSTPMENFLKIEIFFDELNYQTINEEKKYTISSLLASIGGILGFYLGISVVAMFEFLELVTDLMNVHVIKKISHQKEENKISSQSNFNVEGEKNNLTTIS